jgi:hypothetical protein
MPLRVKNIAAGYYDGNGVFHPIRASEDYDPDRVGESAKYKTKAGLRGAKSKAKRAAQIAKASRKARATLKTASKARERAESALKEATKRKKNPIPTNRYVTAKIKRTRSGDLKVILPLR